MHMTTLHCFFFFFFFNDTATTEIYTLSLHDALPISGPLLPRRHPRPHAARAHDQQRGRAVGVRASVQGRQQRDRARSEEHTSELQSPCNLVCRLLLEKKKTKKELSPMTIWSTEYVHF